MAYDTEQIRRLISSKGSLEQSRCSWSPFEIHVLLHHYASAGPFERSDAPAYRDAIEKLTSVGLCEPASHTPCKVTPLGHALVKMWCETPIPEVRYVDPRIAP